MLVALFVIGVGVYMIATANKPTETVTARVSYKFLLASRADAVDFKFPDGSDGSETEPGALVEAVQKFGPGPARVTRNTKNDSIYKVVFHDKTYSLSDPGTDKSGGIVVIVLGALWFGWLLLNALLPETPSARGNESAAPEPPSSDGMGSEQPEPVSEIARLEELLYQVADDIAADDPDDPINRRWSSMLRMYAGQIGARQAAGLEGYFRLFSTDPRNTINEQPFVMTPTFSEASRLAFKLYMEQQAEERRLREVERGLVMRPWQEGRTGKAVVYEDGTVYTCDDTAPGRPQVVDLHDVSGKGGTQVATIGIRPDGACDVLRSDCKACWLDKRLRDHQPLLHLAPTPP
jgi:hypothetical protein